MILSTLDCPSPIRVQSRTSLYLADVGLNQDLVLPHLTSLKRSFGLLDHHNPPPLIATCPCVGSTHHPVHIGDSFDTILSALTHHWHDIASLLSDAALSLKVLKGLNSN